LRPDELVTIDVEHFIPQLFCEHQGRVVGMVVKVKGKCDDKWKYLWIWADDDNPEFCPLRHLLVYIHLTGHRGGPLFPKTAELLQPPADGVYNKPEDYGAFRVAFHKILIDCLPNKGDNLKIGLQMFRKTGYLFGVWGGGEWNLMMESARHRGEKDAKKYRKDAHALNHLNHIFNDPENKVSKWKAILCLAPDTATMMNLDSSAYCKSLDVMAKDFVEQTLELLPTHPSYRDQITVLDRALKYIGVETASAQKEKLFQKLGPEFHADVEQLMSTQAKEQASQRVWELPAPPAPVQTVVDVGAVVEDHEQNLTPPDSNSTKRKRGEGGDDLQRRKWTKTATLEEKVEIMKELEAEKNERMSHVEEGVSDDVTESARTWCSRTMTPAMECIRNHFDGNVAKFCERWRTDFRTKFKYECCNGVRNETNVCST
jgi:hypothetical protein